jgi:hypothetical protein
LVGFQLQTFLETGVTEVTAESDIAPYRGALDHVPRDALASALGLTMEDMNAAKAGDPDAPEPDDRGSGM